MKRCRAVVKKSNILFRNKKENKQRRFQLLVQTCRRRGLVLMRIVRGMQKSFRCSQNKIVLLATNESFSQGIGYNNNKARTRGKSLAWVFYLILVQRGSGSASSTNPTRSSSSSSSSPRPDPQHTTTTTPSTQVVSDSKDKQIAEDFRDNASVEEVLGSSGVSDNNKSVKSDDLLVHNLVNDLNQIESVQIGEPEKFVEDDITESVELIKGLGIENEVPSGVNTAHIVSINVNPPPPPVPPPKPSVSSATTRRQLSGSSNAVRIGSSRRGTAWPIVSTRTSPTGSRPSSPRSHGESEGYNSADEQNPCYVSSYDDFERERQFEIDIRRAKGLEVKRMLEDGNCLFRAVADQVYGDSELYDLTRQMCIDYMERERDHFSQFITEGFTSYCKRKRRDKVYGNNVEIQALSEMYNRPIHIYSYSTEPINTFHGSYHTDTPPVRLSYHHGNHYNSLVDPRRVTVGAGLGFSSLRGQQLPGKESSTSGAEPSSSGARPSGSETNREQGKEGTVQDTSLSSSMQIVLSMGFSYLQAIEAYSIFGDDVDSMVCYLLETGSGSRRKGKATE
ncbi:hypothetical protein ACFE04_027493 [Oxalis oulophora]